MSADALRRAEATSGRLLLATRNPGKLVELRRMLSGFDVVGLADVPEFPEAPETGATFAENALAKARDAAAATGLPSVADDSGLAVDALNGMPGVLSARWSGRHGADRANLELLLAQVGDVPDERRGAAFVCAAALVVPGGPETVVHGEWAGHLTRGPAGHQRVRLRPDLRAGRGDAHVGRAVGGGEGRGVAPGPRAAGTAAPSARTCGAGWRDARLATITRSGPVPWWT